MKKLSLLTLITLTASLLFCGTAFAQHHMRGGHGWNSPQQGIEGPVDMEEAKKILRDYVDNTGNPNLTSGKVEEKTDVYLGEILTKDGSLVDRIEIDKETGWVHNRYGRGWGTPGGGYNSGSDSGWNYCPYCGSGLRDDNYGMGGTMMHHGRGSGMMGPGYGYHHRNWRSRDPMKAGTAKEIVGDYLSSMRNPNLKIGKITEKASVFEVTILTKKKEDLVDVLAVNKYTGFLRSVY